MSGKMDYILIERFSVDGIVTAVRDMIKKGWVPQGSISGFYEMQTPHHRGRSKYVQAMIKSPVNTHSI